MVSEPVNPYFTRFLRVLTFCLESSKIVIFCENGVVNGVVKSSWWMWKGMEIRDRKRNKDLIKLKLLKITRRKEIEEGFIRKSKYIGYKEQRMNYSYY